MSNELTAEAVELDESNPLDKILLYALDEAMEKIKQSGELEPFTVVLHGDNLHIESHPGDDVVECFNAAAAAVKQLAHVAQAYVFAYDGYITTDEDTRDAIIVERGEPDKETAEAFALLYTLDEEGEGYLSFDEGIYDLGPATSLLSNTPVSSDDLEEL